MAANSARPAAFYTPVNYDPATFPEPLRDHAHYFLNLIHWRCCCSQADAAGFVRLKREYLTRVIPKAAWPGIRDRLIAKGVIQADLFYVEGSQSYGFRLAPVCRLTRRVVCQNDDLNRKIRAAHGDEFVPLLSIHRQLKSQFTKLAVDESLAFSINARLEPDADSAMGRDDYQARNADILQYLINGDIWFLCDRFGRVYTPITVLPKPLRSALRLNGLPLVELDLANSQPLIAGLCARQFYSSKWSKSRLLARNFNTSNPYRHGAPDADAASEGVERYVACCETGLFYESLMEPGEDRAEFKTRFYREVLFGRNNTKGTLHKRFRARYPEIAAMLRELKRKDYRRSAWILQNCEATIFVEGICKRVLKQMPDAPILTVHDCLLTTPENAQAVGAILLDEFNRLGCHPMLHQYNHNQSSL